MGVKDRGSVEPQEAAVVNAGPKEEERSGATEAPSSDEIVTAEAAADSSPSAVELLPMPFFHPPLAEIPADVVGNAPTEARVSPAASRSSLSHLEFGLSALAVAGFLSFYRQTHRSPRNGRVGVGNGRC